jgi:hypothetical protein
MNWCIGSRCAVLALIVVAPAMTGLAQFFDGFDNPKLAPAMAVFQSWRRTQPWTSAGVDRATLRSLQLANLRDISFFSSGRGKLHYPGLAS